MAPANEERDKQQIGLTADGQRAIEILMAEDLFDTETDAYKIGISYAIAAGLEPGSAPTGGYTTKFNARGGIDSDGRVSEVIETLGIGETGRTYATAERLAELGITVIARRLQGSENLADIISNPTP